MKSLYLFLLLLTLSYAQAQPGDIVAIRKAKLQKVEKALQADPYNAALLWERINIVFRPHFNLYTKAGNIEDYQDKKTAYSYFLLDDLDYLIASNSSIKKRNNQISLANFYHRRGQFFYKMGYTEYALNDYIAALEANPALRLKQQICLAIAAYYYNKEENYSLENYQKALYYIDLVTPKEDIHKSYVHYSKIQHDHFEREKIQLLKASQQNERLITYLQCIAKKHFLFYQTERAKSADYQKNHSYTMKYSLHLGFDKLYEIATHFYDKGDYAKAKDIIENVISLLPRNTWGHAYETFVYGNYFVLLSKIYQTDMYQNPSLEIDNLLEGMGDPFQGFPSQALQLKQRLNELLQLYPMNSKLYLAKAIYLKKEKYHGGYKKITESPFDYLEKSEALGLQDYRIWYLRAILLKEEKRYEEALTQIIKAQILYGGHPNIYALKLSLLHNRERNTEVNIEIAGTVSLLEDSRKHKKLPIDVIIEMIQGI